MTATTLRRALARRDAAVLVAADTVNVGPHAVSAGASRRSGSRTACSSSPTTRCAPALDRPPQAVDAGRNAGGVSGQKRGRRPRRGVDRVRPQGRDGGAQPPAGGLQCAGRPGPRREHVRRRRGLNALERRGRVIETPDLRRGGVRPLLSSAGGHDGRPGKARQADHRHHRPDHPGERHQLAGASGATGRSGAASVRVVADADGIHLRRPAGHRHGDPDGRAGDLDDAAQLRRAPSRRSPPWRARTLVRARKQIRERACCVPEHVICSVPHASGPGPSTCPRRATRSPSPASSVSATGSSQARGLPEAPVQPWR